MRLNLYPHRRGRHKPSSVSPVTQRGGEVRGDEEETEDRPCVQLMAASCSHSVIQSFSHRVLKAGKVFQGMFYIYY